MNHFPLCPRLHIFVGANFFENFRQPLNPFTCVTGVNNRSVSGIVSWECFALWRLRYHVSCVGVVNTCDVEMQQYHRKRKIQVTEFELMFEGPGAAIHPDTVPGGGGPTGTPGKDHAEQNVVVVPCLRGPIPPPPLSTSSFYLSLLVFSIP